MPGNIGREAAPGRCLAAPRRPVFPAFCFVEMVLHPPPSFPHIVAPPLEDRFRGRIWGWRALPAGHSPRGPRAPPRHGPAAPLFPARPSGRLGAAPGAGTANKEGGGARPAPPPRPSPCFARGGCGAENKGTGRGRGRRVSRAGQSARPRPKALKGRGAKRRGPEPVAPSAPTCPLAFAGEAPAASSAVTSPRGALELWLPMMGGWSVGGARSRPGSRRKGYFGGVGAARRGVGLAPEGEGCVGGNQAARPAPRPARLLRPPPLRSAPECRPPPAEPLIYTLPELGAGPDI